ncbi:histidine triad nucleotide-binding protein 3 [Trichonephila clavata]|uniref:Adenosine 5'-monophosphoramidase HINT3 n=1 Tax=Trichonephila clavata TaxID=2740835 RepID=A0A8X6LBD5_TRICU|nr:histidine triad nucleotide-binding protein 3 [Trichonephila clavata]
MRPLHNTDAEAPTKVWETVQCAILPFLCGHGSLVVMDDNFVAFRNITPAASHHYLVIPKDHIKDAVKLKPYHIPMLYQMEAIAAEILKQQGAVDMATRIGYHWPPFISVNHLHLHVIAPEEELSIKASVIFRPSTKWFLTTKEIVERINNRHLVSSL